MRNGKMKHVSLTLQVENDLKHQLSIGALKLAHA